MKSSRSQLAPSASASSALALLDAPPPTVEPVLLESILPDGEVVHHDDLLVQPEQFPLADFMHLMRASQELQTKAAVVSVVPRYFEFNRIGDRTRGVFVDFTSITKKQDDGSLKDIPCVRWMTNGEMFINGGIALVTTFERINCPRGTPVEISYAQKRGNCKVYDVKLLI